MVFVNSSSSPWALGPRHREEDLIMTRGRRFRQIKRLSSSDWFVVPTALLGQQGAEPVNMAYRNENWRR